MSVPLRFTPAVRSKKKARIVYEGPAGAGKTRLMLGTMRGIVGPTGRIAVADSEEGRALIYADDFGGFDHLPLPTHSPETYIAAIEAAVRGRYDAIGIDSISHEWAGRDGILEFVDMYPASGKFHEGWRKATPIHQRFLRAVLAAPVHVVCTARVKTEYKMEQDAGGRMTVTKVGLAPVLRDGTDYEFDIIGRVDLAQEMRVTKSPAPWLRGLVLPNATDENVATEFGAQVRAWLDAGRGEWTPPAFGRAFRINDREVVTAGLERDTYVALVNEGRAHQDIAKPLLGERTLASLTEQEGQEILLALRGGIKEKEKKAHA